MLQVHGDLCEITPTPSVIFVGLDQTEKHLKNKCAPTQTSSDQNDSDAAHLRLISSVIFLRWRLFVTGYWLINDGLSLNSHISNFLELYSRRQK